MRSLKSIFGAAPAAPSAIAGDVLAEDGAVARPGERTARGATAPGDATAPEAGKLR
jgi:hypothetical protein